jgi:hypothetical protein
VSGASDEKPCCIRCGAVTIAGARGATRQPARAMAAAQGISAAAHGSGGADKTEPIGGDTATVTIRAPLADFDTWELAEQLRHVDRILSGARFSTALQHPAIGAQPPAPTSATRKRLASLSTSDGRPRGSRLRSRVAWTAVAAGAAVLACGILLLCGGALLGHGTWQSIGLPITLLGQVALLLGMMMQLDLVWKGKRETASKLYRFQKRLVDLEALAAELAPATDDDNDSARAGDERELLVELKTRLDLLAHRLNLPCG